MAFGTRQQKPQVSVAPIDQAFLEGEDGPHPVLKHQPQHVGFPHPEAGTQKAAVRNRQKLVTRTIATRSSLCSVLAGARPLGSRFLCRGLKSNLPMHARRVRRRHCENAAKLIPRKQPLVFVSRRKRAMHSHPEPAKLVHLCHPILQKPIRSIQAPNSNTVSRKWNTSSEGNSIKLILREAIGFSIRGFPN